MKLLILTALVAVALASRVSRIPSNSWEEEHFSSQYSVDEESFQPEREYIFRYNGQVATGIPGASKQHSVTQVQAKVSLVFQSNQQVLMTIRKIRVGKLNEEIYNPRAMIPFMSFQPVELRNEQQKKLYLPIQFQYRQGVISELELDSREQPWSANIKRGILNMLQVNLAKNNQVGLNEEALLNNVAPETENEKFQFFSTIEKTIEGKCKTHYTVVSNPSQWESSPQVLNVTRSIDYEECEQRPEIKYNFRFQDPCKRCNERLYQDDQKFLRSSSVAKFNISGTMEDFLIESAIVESQYQVVPFNMQGNMITTYINQTLVLKYAGAIESQNQMRQPQSPVQSDSDLVYTLDWEIQKELFFMKSEESPFDLESTPENLNKILRPLMSEMRESVKENVPMMYLRLVRFIAFTEKPQLKKLFQQYVHNMPESYSPEEHQKIKSLMIDALADAGTKHCIEYLLELISEEKISPLRASLVVKQLINLPLPSKEIVREFARFCQKPIVQKNWILKQSAYLTLGSIVQGVCMPSEDKMALLQRGSNVVPQRQQPNLHLCPKDLQERLIEKLWEEFDQSQENYEDQILILKTIGNMGIPQSIVKLEKIIKSQEQKMIVRVEAILALRQLRELLPNKVVRVLMPIFMNQQAPNELRMAAVYQIFQVMPSRPILDQISRKLFTERSSQVASFVYSYMYTVANTTNPCEKSFSRDLQLSLRHGRRISGAFLPQYSKYLHTTLYSQKYMMGVDMNMASIVNNRTFVPRALLFNLHGRFLGFWSKYLISFGVAQENVESLLSQYLRRTEFTDMSLDQILRQSPRAQTSPIKELKQLWKQLETVARELPSMTPRGFVNLKLKDQEFWMLPISKKSIQSLPSLREIKRTFVQGQHIVFHKAAVLHSFFYKIPTAIGMPLRIATFIPTVSQFSGKIRVEPQSPYKIFLDNLKPSGAISMISRVECWNPMAANGLQIKATAKLNTPVTAKIVLDIKSRMPSLRMSMELPKKPVEWIRLETIPTTYHKQNVLSQQLPHQSTHRTIVGEQWNRINNVRDVQMIRKIEQSIQKIVGMEVRVEGLWHHTQQNAPLYVPVCPFSGPNHLVLRTRPTQDQPKEVVLKMSISHMLPLEKSASFNPIKFQFQEEETFESPRINQQNRKGFQTTLKTELYTKGSSQERRAVLESQIQCTSVLRQCKMTSELQITPIPQLIRRQFNMCLRTQAQLPQRPSQIQQLLSKQIFGELKTTWGWEQCKEENVVEIKLNAQHSQEQKEIYQSQPEFKWFSEERCQQEPSMCNSIEMEDRLQEQQNLLKYNIFARYENVPVLAKNITNKVFRALKNYYYWNVDTMNFLVRNPSQQIRAQITVDPRTRQFFNATIKTPIENVTVTDAELPMPVFYPIHIRRPSFHIQKLGDIFENLIQPVVQQCLVNHRRIQTFDEVKYRAPLSTCWSLLTKDCEDSENPTYAIQMKKLSTESNKKVVKIISYRHKILLTPESEEITVKVDGKVLSEEEYPQTQHLRVEREGDIVSVILPQTGIRVHFDKYTAKIEMSPMMQSTQCGLCGQYNNEQNDEFTTPQNKRTQSPLISFQKYTMKSQDCELPEYEQMSARDFEYEPEWKRQSSQEWSSSSSSESSEEREQEEQNQETPRRMRTVQRIFTQEEGSQICFSTETIPRCPRQSYPSEYVSQEKELTLRCIPRSHEQAHRFLRIARRSQSIPSEMSELLEQIQEEREVYTQIPSQCRRHY